MSKSHHFLSNIFEWIVEKTPNKIPVTPNQDFFRATNLTSLCRRTPSLHRTYSTYGVKISNTILWMPVYSRTSEIGSVLWYLPHLVSMPRWSHLLRFCSLGFSFSYHAESKFCTFSVKYCSSISMKKCQSRGWKYSVRWKRESINGQGSGLRKSMW